MEQVATPKHVESVYDLPLWESIMSRQMKLQRCDACSLWRYPPGPLCPGCGSNESTWVAVSGRAEILSWVIFHRKYLPAYPPPYNVIAVKLEEGPTFISNLEGIEPEESWIGEAVRLVYTEMPDGVILPRFVLT